MSDVGIAEQRLARLQVREAQERLADGLSTHQLDGLEVIQRRGEDALDKDEEMMWDALDELSDVKNERGQGGQNGVTENPALTSPIELGIEDEFRGDIIEWLLDASDNFSSVSLVN